MTVAKAPRGLFITTRCSPPPLTHTPRTDAHSALAHTLPHHSLPVPHRHAVLTALEWVVWLVPGLGLAVRHAARVQLFGTPDAMSMACMSACRVGWMLGVAQGGIPRALGSAPGQQQRSKHARRALP